MKLTRYLFKSETLQVLSNYCTLVAINFLFIALPLTECRFNFTFFFLQMYVCEDCGYTTKEPELHYLHLKEKHPYSPALLKFYDKRHFKFNNTGFASMLLQVNS